MRAASDRVALVSSEKARAVKINAVAGRVTLSVSGQEGNATEEIDAEYAGALRDAFEDWQRRPEVTHRRDWQNVQRTVARIDYDDSNGPLIETSVSGTLEALGRQSVRRALWTYPAMTLGVVARIHWQALKLWLKKVRFFHKPAPPTHLTSR